MSRLPQHEMQMHTAGQQVVNNVISQSGSTGGTMFIPVSPVAAVAVGVAANLIVADANAPNEQKHYASRFNYLIDLKTGWVHVMDIMFMQELLAHKPELNMQYMKEEHPEDAASMIRFLKAAFDE